MHASALHNACVGILVVENVLELCICSITKESLGKNIKKTPP